MPLTKRLSLLTVLVAALVFGLSAVGEAQGRSRGGGGGGRPAGGGGGRPAGGGGGGREVGRPGGGRAVVVARPVVVGRPYYGYYGYYSPYWWGGWGYGYYGYPWYGDFYYGAQYPIGRYPYGYRYADRDSAVRLEVTPKEAEVYVDGYYAGVVDDFDGVFQRLRVAPGSHELTLYHDGYRAVHQTLYLQADATFKVHYTMERLVAGDVAEPRPLPKDPPPDFEGGAPLPGQAQPGQVPPGVQVQPPAPRAPVTRRAPLPPPGAGVPQSNQSSSYGTLVLRVQPGNAIVTIDNERWDAPQGGDRLILELSEGVHRVQVQRDGFDTYSNDVAIRRGETTPLNISLRTR